MSAERLREAATSMREDWPQVDGSDPEIPHFYAAVANWLDDVAWRSENYPKQYRAAKHALAVANAYLGSPS